MLLGKRFEAFIESSPVSVMIQGILERTVAAGELDRLFEETAEVQYSKQLLFSQCIQMMSDVVFRIEPSIGAWYTEHQDSLDVRKQAVYPKLAGIEPQVSAAMLRSTAKEVAQVRRAMGSVPRSLLSGYRVRVLDGTQLAGTQHRIFELRRLAAAALPGQALLMYDPRLDLIDEVVPCEDAYTQERTLCEHVLDLIARLDLIIADTAYCTTKFLFGLAEREAFFVVRQHKTNVRWETAGRRRRVGTDEHGRIVYEQPVHLIHPQTGEVIEARRISVTLRKPDKNGNTELHVLTNVPSQDADAVKILSLYADRWTIETAIQHLKEDLRCEIDTLGYPKAALFGMCVALMSYNSVSLVKGALRATWGREFVEEELSMYYLTLNVAKVTAGMLIAIPEEEWTIFREMSIEEFAATLLELASHLETHKYQKQKRGPKKKQPKKIVDAKHRHYSTSRLIAKRH
jgi:hypothetical protein